VKLYSVEAQQSESSTDVCIQDNNREKRNEILNAQSASGEQDNMNIVLLSPAQIIDSDQCTFDSW
jgi:hypothetical protein